MRHAACTWAALATAGCLFLTGADKPAQETRPADVSQLRDITGIEKEPPQPPRTWWPLLLVPAVVVAAGAAFVCWKYYTRERPAPAPPPDRWALVQLGQLEALGLAVAGQVERYHTLLSDIVRRYLELRFQVQAPQQSTDEFLDAMRRSPRLTAAQEALLREFLRQCDLAKFARAGFSAEECQAAGRMARALVEQTASHNNMRKASGASVLLRCPQNLP